MKLSVSLCNEAINAAIEILEKNISIFKKPNITEIAMNRSMRAFGVCILNYIEHSCKIKFSKPLFEAIPDKCNPYKNLIETAIHELIHTMPGCDNHGQQFKRIARIVSLRTSYHVTAKKSISSFGDEYVQNKETNAKWKITCNYCGASSFMYRRPKYINEFNNRYKCGCCRHTDFKIERAHR